MIRVFAMNYSLYLFTYMYRYMYRYTGIQITNLIGFSYVILLKAFDSTFFLGDVKWQEGRVSGAIYNGGKELTEVLTKVCKGIV